MTQRNIIRKNKLIGHRNKAFFNSALLLPFMSLSIDVPSMVITFILSLIVVSMFVLNKEVLGNINIAKTNFQSQLLFDTSTNSIVFQTPSLFKMLGFRIDSIDTLIDSNMFSTKTKQNVCNLFKEEREHELNEKAVLYTGEEIDMVFKKIIHKNKSMVIIDFTYNENRKKSTQTKHLPSPSVKGKVIQRNIRIKNRYPQTQHTVRMTAPEKGNEEELMNRMLKTTPHHQDQINLQKIEMIDVIHGACKALKKLIKDTNTEIYFEQLPSVYADERQLTHLIKNLFKNSIQYKSHENPKIFIDCRVDDEELIFCVKDNGNGLSDDEYHSKVFTPYYRKHHNGRMIPGLGLGLAVCKYIVNNHKGSIWCENDDIQGSRFYFSLPTPYAIPIARMSEVQSQTCKGCAN